MYTHEEEVIHFVFLAFLGKKRRKENIDLAFHSIMVGNMLKNIGCDELTVTIGYLHDIIEDSEYTYDDLYKKYGKEIADAVLSISEDMTINDFIERKRKFISNLSKANENIIMVELADKLQNLISDYHFYLEGGKDKLKEEYGDFEYIIWYYKELKNLFNNKLKDNELLRRYNQIVDLYFN